MRSLQVGRSSRVIETPAGMDMTGFIARMHPATGVHDQLKTRCMVLDDGDSLLAFAICDLLALSNTVIAEIAKQVEERTAIPVSHVIVSCVHTHSGPASIHLENCGVVDSEWLKRLVNDVADCFCDAKEKLEPAFLTFKTGECFVAYNRVAGQTEDTAGFVDPQVSVLEIAREPGGTPHTILVNYACHPVTLTETNLLFSRDFPYYLEETLRRHVAPKLDVFFTPGCCGDLNPKNMGGFMQAEQTGVELAESILRIPESAVVKELLANPRISVDSFSVTLPIAHDFDDTALMETSEHYERLIHAYYDKTGGAAPDVYTKAYQAYANWARHMLSDLQAGKLQTSFIADIKVIQIGSLVLVSLPFEVFSGIGLKIKRHFGVENTIVIGYANGDFSYLASEDLYDKSIYEIKDSFKYYGYPGPVAREGEQIILSAILN